MIMYHPENGKVDVASSGFSVEELKKAGWVEIVDKSGNIANDGKPKGKPGRKPKNLGVTSDGNRPDTD